MFSGSPRVSVPAGEEVWSDFVSFATSNEEDLARHQRHRHSVLLQQPGREIGEAKRQAVNAWVRANSDVTAVIDFDRLMAAGDNALVMAPSFDSGDHLHPNDVGYEAMARAVESALE